MVLPGIVLAMVIVFFVLQATGALERLRQAAARRKAHPRPARRIRMVDEPGEAVEKRLQVFEEFLKNLSDDDSPKGNPPS